MATAAPSIPVWEMLSSSKRVRVPSEANALSVTFESRAMFNDVKFVSLPRDATPVLVIFGQERMLSDSRVVGRFASAAS